MTDTSTSTNVGEARWWLGGLAVIKATATSTGGQLAIIEVTEPPGMEAPLHVHHNEDEGFYVLAGRVSLYLPGRRIDSQPGDFVLAPRGVPHAYRVGDAPARWLVTSTPAGFERFVAAVAQLDELDPETLAAVAAEHDIEILGPPGMLP